MKAPVLAIFILVSAGCSTGVIVHDQTRAAELIVDFLSSLKSEPGIKLAYDWTADKYQEEVSFHEFSQRISSLRDKNLGKNIKLVGYEVFGARETMVVYAYSAAGENGIHYKFSLFGSKTRDYYLLDFSTKSSEFTKSGLYREYQQAIIIEGV